MGRDHVWDSQAGGEQVVGHRECRVEMNKVHVAGRQRGQALTPSRGRRSHQPDPGIGQRLAVEGARAWRWALLTWALSEAWTLMFYVTDQLPMTVPVAVVVLIREALRAQPHAFRRQVAHGAGP